MIGVRLWLHNKGDIGIGDSGGGVHTLSLREEFDSDYNGVKWRKP